MKHRTLIMAALLACWAGSATAAESAAAAGVPETLQPGAQEALAGVFPAKGVQIYECKAQSAQSGGYQWAFVAPDAELFDARGNRVGHHYAGPHWEAADGSKVIATAKARADAPRPDAIPWLLLTAKSVGPQGRFSRVTSIQRTNTQGGMAPASGCSAATVGTTARVAYSADYRFYEAK